MAVRLSSRLAVLLLAAVALSIGLNLTPRPAYACICAPPASDTAAAERADLVFVGVLADQKIDADTLVRTLDFEVSAVYKGEVAEEERVISGGSNGCGYEPDGAGPHLVFATREVYGEDLSLSYLQAIPCSPSRTVAAGVPDPALGEPSLPAPLPAGPLPFIIAIAVAGAVLVGYAAPWRRRRSE